MQVALTLGQWAHRAAHDLMHTPATLSRDDLPGPLTTSIAHASGAPGGRAAETELMIRQMARQEERLRRIDLLARAVEAISDRYPREGDVIWQVCLAAAPPRRPGRRGRQGWHDPEVVAWYAEAAGISEETLYDWMARGWEVVAVLWAPQEVLEWYLERREKIARALSERARRHQLSDDELEWALGRREELWRGQPLTPP
ncbi:hypothetical protein HRbin24_00536 [bacterium HR24]|nr:hypothetical protein HRbin24_00536 [bacterium HR24]